MPEPIRFQCKTCDVWHEGLPDLAFAVPYQYEQLSRSERELALKTDDVCAIGDDYFIRATLPLKIIGSQDEFNFGAWVSLSERNFRRYLELFESTELAGERPYFGWLCNRFPWYPDTLSLKTSVHLRPYPDRPRIELEPTDHPLAIHQRDGITEETLAEIFAANEHPIE
jgi:hypothetical protein